VLIAVPLPLLPPENTKSVPAELIVAPTSVPPEKTSSCPLSVTSVALPVPPPLAPERTRPPALTPKPALTTVVETASPPEETTRMPPLETFVLVTMPLSDTISVAKLPKPEPETPISVAVSPLPPLSMTRRPPPSTLVWRTVPPESAISVPPLLTMSKFEVTPDEMKNGEFAEVMVLPVMGADRTSNCKPPRGGTMGRAKCPVFRSGRPAPRPRRYGGVSGNENPPACNARRRCSLTVSEAVAARQQTSACRARGCRAPRVLT
jgi:hypothetical protein